MSIIPRSKLPLVPPRHPRTLHWFGNGWFWHWLGNAYPEQMSDIQVLQSVQRYHMNAKGWSDIAYSIAVGREVDKNGEAKAYELRGTRTAGGHTNGYNNSSLAIVFLIGEGEKPTPAMFRKAWQIVQETSHVPDRVRSHRDVGTTACPGDAIAAEVKHQAYKEAPPMSYTSTQAEAIVEREYKAILGRPSDPGGLAFWSRSLVEGLSLESLRHEFLVVRLAADKAVTQALAAKVNDNAAGARGGDAEVVAEQVYRLFLDDLQALAS